MFAHADQDSRQQTGVCLRQHHVSAADSVALLWRANIRACKVSAPAQLTLLLSLESS